MKISQLTYQAKRGIKGPFAEAVFEKCIKLLYRLWPNHSGLRKKKTFIKNKVRILCNVIICVMN